ncbi:uncharacterized protein LOC126236838 [Schistocerca nitens]|uniref:uncharacterized protein LOC126236838 n=1 Tax=Schistocerca nitens TaxID=7011 RepID=UPI00211839B5|nr:uncharacterized protein LOC126236838 [Schistocerca nitens]
MFKYVDGTVADVRVVDFQFSKVHSPAADVQCFLNANASEQLHRQHFDSLVVEYHGALQRTLRALGLHQQADAYPLRQLRADMDRSAVLRLFNCALRGLHLGKESHSDQVGQAFKKSDESSAALAATYSNPECVSYLKYIAPIYESKGLL